MKRLRLTRRATCPRRRRYSPRPRPWPTTCSRCASHPSPSRTAARSSCPVARLRCSFTRCSAISLEGQRQRGDQEGQTFTKLLNKPILPTFLSVADDPTLTNFEGHPLSGHYSYDDEGQPARRVQLVDDGVLKTFLMSRLPVASFGQSNGHGRAETGKMPTGRQGNLIVTSTRQVTDAELREQLKAEAKKQGKAYGLYFEDISSGFAVTTRSSPQAFSVIPLVVYRVFVDGRPDELVRGVSIVGTPQFALNSIVATGNHQEIFNGICGAESGSIPVSAVAPSMLVSSIETQRQAQGTARPPIVPPPPVAQKVGQ